MASESGGDTGLGVVVGALLVLVLIIGAVMVFGGGALFGGGHKSVDVNISPPSIPAPK